MAPGPLSQNPAEPNRRTALHQDSDETLAVSHSYDGTSERPSRVAFTVPDSSSSTDDTPTLSGNTPDGSPIPGRRSNEGKSTDGSIAKKMIDHPMNENSPLLSPRSSDDAENDDRSVSDDDYDAYQETRSWWYLVLTCISIGGLQIAWSVELSNGSPFLLSLGLSKSLMALVWIAGPLSGTLVQPYVGIRSDNCRISWGKRKPFMVAGTAATIVSLMALSWVKEIVRGILGLFGADAGGNAVHVSTICVAVLFVYVLDFAINTVQAAIRAFMVDCVPTHQQESTNAWASRITGIGNIIGYMSGYINLPKYIPFLGDTQFKCLCAIASLTLLTTVAISCIFVKERDPRLEGPPSHDPAGGVKAFFKSTFSSIRSLPPQTKKVCETQFFAWIAWFPVLFYVSSWISELWVQPFLEKNPHMSMEELNALYEKGTRRGTFALLIYAITSLSANLILPMIVYPTYDMAAAQSLSHSTSGDSSQRESRYQRFLNRLIIPWLTLRRAWVLSLILFGLCLFASYFIRTPGTATVLVGLIGVCWAMALWAPFAIISAEISKRDALRRSRANNPNYVINAANQSNAENGGEEEDLTDQAGILLGIHNMAIAAPQIIATLGSSAIFKSLQKPRGTPGDRSLGVVLASAGIFALIAAWVAARIREEVPAKGAEYEAVADGETREAGRQSMESDASGGRNRKSSEYPSNRSSMHMERRRSQPLVRSASFGAALNY